MLLTILWSQRLRQESDDLLLANTLLSELAYVVFHVLISSSNLGSWALGCITCGVLTDAVFAAHTSTVLSFAATMLHTSRAVPCPPHGLSLTSCEAAQEAVALIWLVACFLPTFLIGSASSRMPALITHCFWRIYAEARTSQLFLGQRHLA
ncbi:hypothetical protein HPG69_013648 [Diceros bicornis minor]|uniref:Uncharacterized protein n=1 Tax=Diceros bicornis minor TaxID=77932 RepID=A0A7J7FME2_DICBM|nr:hypothetical protein HPG69_013648 [Diceros bicornis minor]